MELTLSSATLHHPTTLQNPWSRLLTQNLPITLNALINDTTGTLIASHYVNPRTKIACIFGTGCNAAYMEHVSDVEKINGLGIDPGADMAINCEWVRAPLPTLGTIDTNFIVFQGAFDSFDHEHLPRTKFDTIVDETSNKPGEQAFEVCYIPSV
jgi:hexokinase